MATMKYLTDKPGTPAVLVIDDFFSEEDQKLIWDEINFLKHRMEAKTEEDSCFETLNVTEIYTSAKISNILEMTGKIVNPDFINHIIREGTYFRYLGMCSKCSTEMLYMKNDSFHTEHLDQGIFTMYFWIRKQDSEVLDGELYLKDFDLTIEQKNNRVVFVPSVYSREIKKLKMASDDKGRGIYTFKNILS